ncbi:hypothetical protein [Methanoculleus bourgensis]|nr:hypothetical protein [Methanoculleus bourgensis]
MTSNDAPERRGVKGNSWMEAAGTGETIVSYRSRHQPGVHRVRPVVANRS